jgi:hypothetical protein|tara:strand:- start:59 stop:208 length:150 start_codon:yes stop_codon:yes gene_type:complete
MMKGYKTYIAAGIVAVNAVLTYLGHGQYTELLYGLAAALGLSGIRNAMK